jgi:hypothetical protein
MDSSYYACGLGGLTTPMSAGHAAVITYMGANVRSELHRMGAMLRLIVDD